MQMKPRLACLLVCLLLVCATAWAQSPESTPSTVLINAKYDVTGNITYGVMNNYPLKLDVYRPRAAKAPTPVVVFIHGGGWVAGDKEGAATYVLPYLEMGWAAVNVEYRLAKISLAPAAVEDCRCAMHWIGRNAGKYNFDVKKIVVTGGSAGGHLALTTGMFELSDGFDNNCAWEDDTKWSGPWTDMAPKVAAIVNWFGITDVAEMLQGPGLRSWAVGWFGSMPNRMELAKELSPINHIHAGLPPVLTIHGDADPLVPYSQAVRLHQALDKAGVRNQLLTIPGGGHDGFTPEQMVHAYQVIREFLAKSGLTAVP